MIFGGPTNRPTNRQTDGPTDLGIKAHSRSLKKHGHKNFIYSVMGKLRDKYQKEEWVV